MSAPFPALNSALVDALDDSIPLNALIGDNIFSGIVPTTSAGKYPRITIGEASDRDAIGTEGATFNKTTRAIGENIHIWTRKGRKELIDIYAEIYATLHRAKLVLNTGQMLSSGSVMLVTDITDPDGVTLHGIVRFSASII